MSDFLRPHGLQHTRFPVHHTRFPVHHQLQELIQTHVHQVGDAIQPSHPLSSPSPLALNLSHHQGVFQWVSSLHQVARVLEFQLQHQSFQWIFRTNFLYNGLVGSPCHPRNSQESSPTPQFKSNNSSVLSFLYSPTVWTYWGLLCLIEAITQWIKGIIWLGGLLTLTYICKRFWYERTNLLKDWCLFNFSSSFITLLLCCSNF